MSENQESQTTQGLDDKQLRAYISATFGHSFPKDTDRDVMLRFIDDQNRKTPGNAEMVVDPKEKRQLKQGFCRIRIFKESVSGAGRGKRQRPAVVGVNGKIYTIPREIPVIVPDSIVGVLEHAKQGLSYWDEERNELVHEDEYTYKFEVLERFDTKKAADAAKAAEKAAKTNKDD